MLDKEINKFFLEQLRSRFIEIGLSKTISSKVAKLISNAVVLDKKVVSTCHDPFYLDQVITPQKHEIEHIVKMCWGEEFSFEIDTKQKDKSTAKNSTHTQNPSKDQTQLNFVSPPFENIEIACAQFDERDKSDSTIMNCHRSRAIEADLNFKTFIPCESNIAAYSACEAIVKNPGSLSNPLFIYGSTGLGKTHLLHSVGNEILRTNPNSNVLYITSNDFVNDVIHRGIKGGRMEEVRRKYNSCDTLLVDDIQFLENKDACQIEFFHIFNELYQKKKQLVFTSDKFPKDIPNIEERLKSRFLQGLLVDIEPPFFEDRVAIIEVKANQIDLKINRDISFLIAKYAKTNIREIEGLLKDLLIAKQITGSEPTIESVNTILKRRFPNQPYRNNLDITEIQRGVCNHFEIKMADLMSQNRQKKFVIARHIAMFLSKEVLNLNIMQISDAFGKKGHTTALHAISKIKEMMEQELEMKEIIEQIKMNLTQSVQK